MPNVDDRVAIPVEASAFCRAPSSPTWTTCDLDADQTNAKSVTGSRSVRYSLHKWARLTINTRELN